MPTEPYKPKIFISYAHEDGPEGKAKWLPFVYSFLDPGIKDEAYIVWTDLLIRGGEDWNLKIEQKLRDCDIFIVLISRYSTSSSYIVDKEIAIIRHRQSKREDVHFYPILLTSTPKAGLKKVNDKNLRPRGYKPLRRFSTYKREEQMCEIADELEEIARDISRGKTFGTEAEEKEVR
jgi:TIR domain